MATAYNIQVSPTEDVGIFNMNPRADSARKVSKLLQEDMQKHDIYFNDKGFHNHIVHHLLTIFSLGASPEEIQRAYDTNDEYQRPSKPIDKSLVQKFQNRDEFRQFLGQRPKYVQYLAHFQREIDSRGVNAVVEEYLFAGDEFADAMLARLFAGFVHPWIHLGFGLEFHQPAIVAQGLAEAATHSAGDLTQYLFLSEKEGNARKEKNEESALLVDLQARIRQNRKIREAITYQDAEKLSALIEKAGQDVIAITSQFHVKHDQIDEKMAELMNATVYFNGTSQRKDKPVKFDFYYMHCLNSNIFLPTFLSLPFLTEQSKVRLIEWKARVDLALYASRHPLEPLPDVVTNYPTNKSWQQAAHATITHPGEDGHASKLVRMLGLGEKVCKGYEGKEGFLVQGDMWLRLANMCADSIYPPGPMQGRWIFGYGFDEAWDVDLAVDPQE
ncbi:hypothetical protein AAP_04388 [Ascosphaera apis ARSEF 7405]|uniref:HypA-like protein n=1 Tax=Ascosphaera apis ARSEF 7405 TaxID=392613 RepID=A0A167WT63_9EURO|nr:hypothetical protein AAP_04388 [Ascosphaera apis ARSEF 7405]